jgi:hypothetical protein
MSFFCANKSVIIFKNTIIIKKKQKNNKNKKEKQERKTKITQMGNCASFATANSLNEAGDKIAADLLEKRAAFEMRLVQLFARDFARSIRSVVEGCLKSGDMQYGNIFSISSDSRIRVCVNDGDVEDSEQLEFENSCRTTLLNEWFLSTLYSNAPLHNASNDLWTMIAAAAYEDQKQEEGREDFLLGRVYDEPPAISLVRPPAILRFKILKSLSLPHLPVPQSAVFQAPTDSPVVNLPEVLLSPIVNSGFAICMNRKLAHEKDNRTFRV